MKHALPLFAATALALAVSAAAQETDAPAAPSPNAIVEAAPSDAWRSIAPEDLVVMTLPPLDDGTERRVVIQLISEPFSQGWVENIRTLARAHYWDGTQIVRVQDNYVVQWGQPDPGMGFEEKPVPPGLNVMDEGDYEVAIGAPLNRALGKQLARGEATLRAAFAEPTGERKVQAIKRAIPRDPYADETIAFDGWPVAVDSETRTAWPVHCYGMVGVGRGLSPDTGDGSQLYTVIGHAPRHLDRNIAVVGRVIDGIEHLSSLPRGTGPLGFYEDEAKLVPIVSTRLASDLPEAQRPAFEYLSTESETFARYVDARANRRDPFFVAPAGGADICNIPVPVRAVAAR